MEFIRDIYEPHVLTSVRDIDSRRQKEIYRRTVRRAILSMARKNGKTALIAALVLVHLVGPEAVKNGEIYSGANDRKQAAQVFKFAAQMVRADPELLQMIKITDSTKRMACYSMGSFYEAMSAEVGTKHGLNPTFAIYDELAQAKNRELYDVIDTSFGARSEPLFAVISTQSNDPQHILSQLIDDGTSKADPSIVCHLYAVPDDVDDIFEEEEWYKANPALGDFRDLTDLRTLALKAQRMPSEEPKFRNLYLNQRVSPTSSLISRAEWSKCAGDATIDEGEDIYLALDLSSVNDLTALIGIAAGSGDDRIMPFLWKPEELLKEHSIRDFGAGNLRYVDWHKEGYLLTTPGKTIDRESVAIFIIELCSRYSVKALAYDRWRMADLKKEFSRLQFEVYEDGEPENGLRLVSWGQGFKDMTPAIEALEKTVIDGTLTHPANPVLTWNIGNAVAVYDPAGGKKLDKSKARFRIDGATALVMACGIKSRDLKQEPGPSVYTTGGRGILVM